MSKRDPASKTIVTRVQGSYSNIARAMAANSKRQASALPPSKSAIPTYPGLKLRTRQKRS